MRIHRPILRLIRLYDTAWNRLQLGRVRVDIAATPLIRGRIRVNPIDGCHRAMLRIGTGVQINSGVGNAIGGVQSAFLFLSDDAEIWLQDGAGISNVVIAAATRVHVGKHVHLGAGSRIYDNDFHSLHHTERVAGNVGIKTAPVTIGDHAFIGAFATILKGVSIGEGSVIGAGSVVTKSVPARQIWGGNPARYVCDLPPPPSSPGPKFRRPLRSDSGDLR